jgi:predicted ATP-dependent endonuclease of OLD family
MKIRTISVNGLFGRYDHTINIFGEGITYIHSPNGFGKSTILKMVYLLLKGNVDDLGKIEFDRMDISFDNGTGIIAEKDGNGLFIQMQRNELETPLTKDELSSVMGVTYIPSDRAFVRKIDGRVVPAAESYANELSDKLRFAKEHHELIVPDYENVMDDDKLVHWAKDLNAKLNFIRGAGFDIDMPPGLRFPPTRYDLSESRKEYTDLIYGVSEFVDRDYQLSESVIVLKDLLNAFFSDKELQIDDRGNIVLMTDGGVTLPLNDLSAGEKQILIIFYRLLFQTATGSMVMIDEPEISLHVAWQQKIGNAFRDVARLRDLQLLISTHSPQIIHHDWDLTNELRAGRA